MSCPFGSWHKDIWHSDMPAGHPFLPVPRTAHSHGCGSWGWYLHIWWSGSWSFGSLRVSLEVLSLITITKIQVWISLVPTRQALMRLGLEVQIYSYHNQATTHSLYHSVHHLRVAHFCMTSCMSLLQSECLLHLHNILDTTDVASRWAEYAFKTLVPNRILSHLAKVNEHSGLCGLSKRAWEWG